jgi:hypothetical protein
VTSTAVTSRRADLSIAEVPHDQVDKVVVADPENHHHVDLTKQNLDH